MQYSFVLASVLPASWISVVVRSVSPFFDEVHEAMRMKTGLIGVSFS